MILHDIIFCNTDCKVLINNISVWSCVCSPIERYIKKENKAQTLSFLVILSVTCIFGDIISYMYFQWNKTIFRKTILPLLGGFFHILDRKQKCLIIIYNQVDISLKQGLLLHCIISDSVHHCWTTVSFCTQT